MPGPYCLCNGKMRCCGWLAGGHWPPLQFLEAVYTTVTSVSQSPVTAYLPLPAGIK